MEQREKNNPQVQDNIIVVPFQMQADICRSHAKGVDLGAIAMICNTSELVVKAIIRQFTRKNLKAKYLDDKEPA